VKEKEISSKHNAKFKLWLSLLESKGIKSEGLCLVSGTKVIHELLRQRPGSISEFILPPKGTAPVSGPAATRLPGEMFNQLDIAGTKGAIAVVKCGTLPKWGGGVPQGLQLIVALSDPHNLGALLRSADAFGVDAVILTKECSSPFLPRALRAASGSAFRLPLYSGPSIHELAVERAFGLDLGGRNIYETVWPRDMYLILGEEGQGLPAGLKLTRVTIPMSAAVESLNAVAAAAVSLYSYRQRFPLPPKFNVSP